MPTFRKRRWLHLPITINVTLMVLNIALMVCWIVLLARFRTWSMLTIGTIIFALTLVGLGFYLAISIRTWRLQLQQQNFVDSVTHELKTPIASLRLYLETLQMREMSTEQRGSFYSTMERELKRLDHLISQLLEVGRLDAIDQHAEPEDIPLEPLLRQCASAACAHLNCQPEAIHFDLQPAAIHGRRIVLEMIFGNLIDNALEVRRKSPQVEVELRTTDAGRIVTRIADNGAGVPPHLRKKIFKLFYRGGNELERRQKGTGLGLYIVRTLVHLLKGTVVVLDRSGKPGSVFEVDLPGRGVGMRILVVEDEQALADGLKFNFELEGYEVTCVGDGLSAVRLFEEAATPIDLVVLDLMLPGLSGYEVCTTIRSRDHDVPIIILSARSMSEDRRLAFDCGTDQYLSKPFALPELLSRVRNLLEKTRRRKGLNSARGPDTYAFGEVTVDFRRYEVTVRGKSHHLTELELQLLRYFIEHEGAVLTRAEIVKNVWEEKPEMTTRSIDNFVLRLRRIIEANPSTPRHILSGARAGYRFLASPGESPPDASEASSTEGAAGESEDTGVG